MTKRKNSLMQAEHHVAGAFSQLTKALEWLGPNHPEECRQILALNTQVAPLMCTLRRKLEGGGPITVELCGTSIEDHQEQPGMVLFEGRFRAVAPHGSAEYLSFMDMVKRMNKSTAMLRVEVVE